MTPVVPALDPLPLPAPAWLLSALLSLTFTLHLVPMNLLLGGSIVAVVARIRGRRDPNAAALARLIAKAMPVVFAATVTLGVAALLFLQVLYGRVFFPGAVLLAVPWILVVPLLITAYYAAYALGPRAPGPAVKSHAAAVAGRGAGISGREHDTVTVTDPPWNAEVWLAVVVAVLVTLVGFVQANVMSLLLRPEAFASMYFGDASGLRLNIGDPTLVPRFLHVVIGALAVTGLAAAVAGFVLRTREPTLGPWMTRHGAALCAGATVVNILPGFWWLAALPSGMLLQFMGRNLAATLWLAGGVIAALGVIAHVIPAAMAKNSRGLVSGAAGSMLLTLICMVGMRDVARRASLGPNILAAPTWVEPQWGAIALFFALLLTAVGLVWWMVRALVRGRAV